MQTKSKRLAMLKEQHQHLDDIIDEMNSQRFLSAKEKHSLATLKVRRLRLKDSIFSLQTKPSGISMLPPKFELK